MEFWDKKLGLGIKLRRKEMNIRQVDLAERLHVEPTTISRWETGSGSPDISILPNLAYELGTTVDDLLGAKKKNKEDEIKKVKIDYLKFISVFSKILIVLLLILIVADVIFLKINFFKIFYLEFSIIDKYLLLIFLNVIAIIFVCSNQIKKFVIFKTYKMKYYHKYPIGYKFEIKESYLFFLNVAIFFIALFIDVLLILG